MPDTNAEDGGVGGDDGNLQLDDSVDQSPAEPPVDEGDRSVLEEPQPQAHIPSTDCPTVGDHATSSERDSTMVPVDPALASWLEGYHGYQLSFRQNVQELTGKSLACQATLKGLRESQDEKERELARVLAELQTIKDRIKATMEEEGHASRRMAEWKKVQVNLGL